MIFSKNRIFQTLLSLTSLYSCIAFASEPYMSGSSPIFKDMCWVSKVRPIISIFGGYAQIRSGDSHSYTGTDDEEFIYDNNDDAENRGVIGAFFGGEWPLPNPDILTQLGLEYHYFSKTNIEGINTTGIEPATITSYNYRYHLQNQQLLIVSKWLLTTYQIVHPYALIGIGAAFNRTSDFSASTSQTGSVNVTPTFDGQTKTSFTYALGLGVDVDLTKTIRVGLAYQFTDLGKSTLDDGEVVFNNYQANVPFALSSDHAYVNELIASVSIIL